MAAAEFPKPYVKWSCEPARAADVPAAIARAYYVARQPPNGPTFVSVPADDWDAPAEAARPRAAGRALAPDPAALARVATALNRARRPALVVGPAVDRDGVWDATVALAERTRAAVWVSPFSSRASFPENHPLFMGFLVAERRAVARALAEHDVIVVLGAPVFTYHVASEGPVIPDGVTLFQLTADPESAAMAPVGESVLATLDLAVPALLALVEPPERAMPPTHPRASRPSLSESPTAEWVLRAVAEALPTHGIIVEEAPSHRQAMHAQLPILRSGSFYAGAGGGLGWGLPGAVGAALADPTRPVVCLLGDGSSMYSIQALWTAAQHALPLTIVVLNNGGYVALKSFGQLLDVPHPPGVDLPGLDLVSIARGHGCAAERVMRAADLPARLAAAIASGGPTLLDVPVDAAIPALY